MIEEIWKDVRDYEGIYKVSNYGRVWSYINDRIIKTYKVKKTGYMSLSLGRNNTKFVHRLVFEAFYRRLLPNEHVHHINQVRDCNISTNLVAVDRSIHVHNHQKGKPEPEEKRKRISQTMKGRKRSPEAAAKMVQTKRLKKQLNLHD